MSISLGKSKRKPFVKSFGLHYYKLILINVHSYYFNDLILMFLWFCYADTKEFLPDFVFEFDCIFAAFIALIILGARLIVCLESAFLIHFFPFLLPFDHDVDGALYYLSSSSSSGSKWFSSLYHSLQSNSSSVKLAE